MENIGQDKSLVIKPSSDLMKVEHIGEWTAYPNRNRDGILINDGGTVKVLEIFNNRSELDLRQIDLKKYDIAEPLSVYRGCSYWGYKGNPYFLLVNAVPDENDNLILHPDTVGWASSAFYTDEFYTVKLYSGEDYAVHSLVVNEVIIGENVQSYFCSFCDVRCNYLEVRTDSAYFLQCGLYHLAKNAKVIYAPKYLIGEFTEKSVKPNLVAGFLLKYKDDKTLSEAVKNSYFRYIKLRYKDLILSATKYPAILDYVIENKLLKAEDYYALDKLTADFPRLSAKVKEYFNGVFPIEKRSEAVDYNELLRVDIDSENGIDFSAKTVPVDDWVGEVPEYRDGIGAFCPRRDIPGHIIPIRHKLRTYIKKSLNEGDVFIGEYSGEAVRLKLIKLPDAHNTYARFKIIEYKFKSESDEKTFLPALTSHDVEAFSYENSPKILKVFYLQNRYYKNGDLGLYAHSGLFKTVCVNGEYRTISRFLNSNDYILPQHFYSLFEPYFYIPVPHKVSESDEKEFIFFRREKVCGKRRAYSEYDDLLVDLNNYGCAVQQPFSVIKGVVGKTYVSKSGVEYDLKDLILLINEILNVKKRDVNELMVATYVREKTNAGGVDYSKLSVAEVKTVLKKYFTADVFGAFYLGYDTWFLSETDLCCYEKKWFNLFYDAIKTNSCVELKKCSDIIAFVPKRSVKYFSMFSIPIINCGAFIGVAKKCERFDTFETVIKEFIENTQR